MYQGNARLQSWLLKSLLIFRPRLWTDQNHYTDLQTKTAQNPYPLKRYIHVHVSSISFNKEETTRLWGQSFWLLVVSISYVIVCHRVMHLWNMRLTRKPKLQWMPWMDQTSLNKRLLWIGRLSRDHKKLLGKPWSCLIYFFVFTCYDFKIIVLMYNTTSVSYFFAAISHQPRSIVYVVCQCGTPLLFLFYLENQ